jgi:Zn-dependent protease
VRRGRSLHDNLLSGAAAVGFIVAVFVCVVLHELGHALAARRFGVRTRDIIILPIGGVARLERIPENPTHELVIAVAGPAVNVLIAAAILAFLIATGALAALPGPGADVAAYLRDAGFLHNLMAVNIFLVLFNLLPAFPMDGGRVLRALLHYVLDYPTATRIAAGVGQVMAVGFVLLGIFWSPMLILIALFVFLGAGAEAQAVQQRSVVTGLSVADAMMREFHTLDAADPLSLAAERLLAGSQQDFPVVAREGGGRVQGILLRSDLVRALASSGADARVGEAMRRDCPVVAPTDPLDGVFQIMRESGFTALPVVNGQAVVGLITAENVGELMLIRQAMGRPQRS